MYLEYCLATEFMILKTFLIMWEQTCCIKFKILKQELYEFQIHYNHSYVEYAWKKDKKEIHQNFSTSCLRVVRFLVFFFFIHFSIFQILNHESALLSLLEWGKFLHVRVWKITMVPF